MLPSLLPRLLRHVVLLLFVLFSFPAFATQTTNYGIHAVPPLGKVTIDGKLDDWDLSGQVLMCYDIETLRDVYSAQVAMMHDAENLYIALQWKDPIPMGNSHHPRFQANKGWAGDAVQLRIRTDRISHVTAWYYAAAQEPALQISYGKSLTEPFGGGELQLFRTQGWKLDSGAEMAFAKDIDKKGYVQEIKLPWKLITSEKAPQNGEAFACGVELLWGEADWPVHRYADNLQPGATSREFFWTAREAWGPVFLEARGGLTLPEAEHFKAVRSGGQLVQGPVEIRYQLPKDARVTLAIDDANGKRIRNLILALPRKKGANVEKWDGLDDNGKIAPPGAYKFTALYHDGIRVNYVMSFANPGNPSWDTPDGRGAFYGDHTAPQGVAAAGDYVALASPMGEAGKHLIGCDLSGQRLWGLANRVAFDGGHISLATDGKVLWVASEGKESIIYRVNITNGQYLPWQRTQKDAAGNETPVLDLKVSDLPGVGADAKAGPNVRSITYWKGFLVVCLQRENLIKVLDAQTGDVKSTLKIEEPRSAVILSQKVPGLLVVLTKDHVRWAAGIVDATGVIKGSFPFNAGRNPASMADAYPDGYSLTVDANDSVYLSVRGADHNVKVFSPTGKFLREIGKRGGRAARGTFDEKAMRNPAQIAVDSQGRLWVTEETQNPKRTSVWTLNGKLLRDFVGTTHYAAAGALNPHDPTMGFSDDTVYQLDLTKGSYRPLWSLGGSAAENDWFPPAAEARSRIIVRDGATYVYTTGSADTSTDVQCTLFKNGVWRAASHVGRVRVPKDGKGLYANPLFTGHDGEAYSWADSNGDGLVQNEEMRFVSLTVNGQPVKLRSFYWGQLPGEDGTISYLADKGNALIQFPISQLTKCGAPLYEVAKPLVVIADQPVLGSGNGEGMIMGGSDGRVYLNQDPLICVDKNGHVLGGYPNHNTSVHGSHSATSARPGYVIGPSSILGTANFGDYEVWDMNGNLGENYLFTHDGLFIKSLFKDVRGGFETPEQAVRGMSMDATTAGGESFGGHFMKAPNGKVYLTIGGTDARVLEVSGLNDIKRFKGDFQFTPAQWDEAQKFAQQKAAQANEARTYQIAKAQAPISIDGKATEWPELLDDKAAVIEIRESPRQRFARVQARYDEQNLYVAWRVLGRGKMTNVGQDYRLLFKTGDAVDLMLALPEISKMAGLRLLLTQTANGPQAVLYEKMVPGTIETARVPFSSPWRTIYFDRVSQSAEVKFASGAINGGYFVEAAIPWKMLGLTPQSGLKLRGDLGVLFADNGGTQTTSRQYWSNKATGLVNDVPGEADLTPKLWGEFVLQ